MEAIDLRSLFKQNPSADEVRRMRATAKKLCLLFVLFAALTLLLLPLITRFFQDPAVFRAWAERRGAMGKVGFVGLMTLQIVIPFLPGEPMEVAAGLAFGAFHGLLLCMASAFLGGIIVFYLVKCLKPGSLDLFFSEKALKQAAFLRDEKRFTLLFLLLYLFPGTPKDVLAYIAGSTEMKLSTYLLISTFARIPSILTSTAAGSALTEKRFLLFALIYGLTAILSIIGYLIYYRLSRRRCS